MEYVTYVLITLGIAALCVMIFWRKDLFAGERSRLPEAPVQAENNADPRLNVPTPWGWPGSDSVTRAAEERTVSESLHRFVDHLISEKQTIEDQEYLLKKHESLRLLMEDRYGRSGTSVRYDSRIASKDNQDAGDLPIVVDRSRGSLHDVRKPWGW